MAALTAPTSTPQLGISPSLSLFKAPIAANAKIYAGAIVCINAAGYAVPGSTSATLRVLGVATKTWDNTGGAAGAFNVEARAGVFCVNNSTAADLIAQANVGATVYLVDDNTVALTNGSNTRSAAGVVVDLIDGKVAVRLALV